MIKKNLYKEQIFSLDNILSKNECNEIINKANEKGWNDSSPSGGGHGRTGNEDARDNKFCVYYDIELASKLMKKIQVHLQENLEYLGQNVYFNSITKGSEWKPSFIYDKIRIYKYHEQTCFPEHIDYKVKRTIFRDEKEYVQQSFLTLLIYLNDDFEGGQTGYWPDHNGIHCRFLRNVEKQCTRKDHQVLIQPKIGMAVIQDQNILHEGLPTTKGIKYILRTDIIHEREVIPNPKIKKEDKNKNGDWERLFETSCKNYAD
jgi:prolyl 4-hydroxylase